MVFKDIPGYEGLYSVTKCGKVFSHSRNKFLAQSYSHNGYLKLSLCKEGKLTNFRVHRLVIGTFKNIEKLPVNHINGIKTDNRLENLEYTSHKKNMKHAKDNGLLLYRKIDRETKDRIIKLYASGKHSHRSIAKLFNLSHSSAGAVLRGERN